MNIAYLPYTDYSVFLGDWMLNCLYRSSYTIGKITAKCRKRIRCYLQTSRICRNKEGATGA